MKKVLALAVLCVLAAGFTGCSSVKAPFRPSVGLISNISAPLSINPNNTPVSSKKGEASSTCILGLLATGDTSTQTAAKNGGLKKIHYLDYKYFSVLGLYQKTTVVAHGE